MAIIDRPWVILRFFHQGPFLTVGYRDSLHRREQQSVYFGHAGDYASGLASTLQTLPIEIFAKDFGNQSSSIPVFIQLPPFDVLRNQQQQLLNVIRVSLPSHSFELVLLAEGRPMRRPLFWLPLRLMSAGELASDALHDLKRHSWFRDAVPELGLRLSFSSAEDLTGKLESEGADVVMAEDFGLVLQAMNGLPAIKLPRLVLVYEKSLDRPIRRVPEGVAILRMTLPQPAIENFVFQLVHDKPIHEAMRIARDSLPSSETQLIADPLSNHSLRLSDAYLHLRHQSDRAKIHLFSNRPQIGWDLHMESLRGLMKRLPNFSFTHETTGLEPMTHLLQGVTKANEVIQLTKGWTQPVPALEEEVDGRTVNVGLRRLDTEPFCEDVDPQRTLQRSAAYELRVNIGELHENSLVVGPQPAISTLLPPTEDQYELEITVQAKDFRLLSDRSRKLQLPRRGPSDPVYFRVRAPEENGSAQLRICVYYRNYLVQSYVLGALIGPEETRQAEQVLSATLEFSRLKDQPWDVEQLKPRHLSLGVNQGAQTHQIIVKGSQASGELTLYPNTFSSEVKKLREVLDALVLDSAGNERAFASVSVGQQPAPDVAETFRTLARRGRELYQPLYRSAAKNAALRLALLKVASAQDEKLQIVRFDDTFVFPWTLLYDFNLPEERPGDPPAPVCLGSVLDNSGSAVPCTHTYRDEIFCVRGFWGVRHQVEELLKQDVGAAQTVPRPNTGPIRLVAGFNVIEGPTLQQDLIQIEGTTVTGPLDGKPLLDILWNDPPERPSILIFLAHLEKNDRPFEPTGPRIVLGPSKWLTLKSLGDKVSGNVGWNSPRPIIMQMTCNSADIDADTLNHFLLQWNTAGAAAIIGTEARIGSKMAAGCAKELAQELWNKKHLGEAVTGVRRKLVQDGNPLGFLLTAYGDVDLNIL